MKIAIYSRKSKFTGKGESIENQVELCREYIHQNMQNAAEMEILVFEDEGFSGGNMDRPQFKQMLQLAKTQKIDCIICYRLDRISRNVGDFAQLIELLNRQGVAFVCIREQFDTSSPMGRAMMYIASVFAQLERETIAERIRDNLYLLSRSGRWLGGVTPLGFCSARLELPSAGQRTRVAFQLTPLEAESDLVKLIFSKFIEYSSLGGVVRFLKQSGFFTRSGKSFGNMAVKGILTNPVYCAADGSAYDYFYEKGCSLAFEKSACDGLHGLMPYNRTNHANGRQTRNDISEWMLAIGMHNALIPSKDFIKVNEILQQKKAKNVHQTRSPHTSPALLSGLLRCADCGGFMRPHLHSNRAYADGTIPYFYICEKKERSLRHECQRNNADGHAIDQAVWRELMRLGLSSTAAAGHLRLLPHACAGLDNFYESQQNLLRRQLEHKRGMIQNLVLELAGGPTDDFAAEAIRAQINELHGHCLVLEGQLEQNIAAFQEQQPDDSKPRPAKDDLSPSSILESCSANKKRAFLRLVVERIVWDGSQAHIYLIESNTRPI